MNSDYLTPVNKFEPSSSVIYPSEVEVLPIDDTEGSKMSVLEAGYMFSVVLKRQKIKSDLEGLFDFRTLNDEVDFIASNPELIKLLPGIRNEVLKKIGLDTKLTLELLKEDDDWNTLFIIVSRNEEIEWDLANSYSSDFFSTLFEFFPSIARKLNIEFT